MRHGNASLDARGRKLWPVRIVANGNTIDSFVDHKAIVRIDPAKLSELEHAHLRVVENLMPSIGIYSVESTDAEDGLDIAVRLAKPQARPGAILEIIPNLHLRLERHAEPFVPDDPRFLGQWYFDEKRLQMSEVWAISQGDPKTTVVVIDSGCDLTHPDLVDKLDPGLDVIDDDTDPSYDPAFSGAEHGTACAGLIGASTNNGIGIAGACPSCRIRCVRMLTDVAVSLDAHVKAFNFALETNAAVVSNSWGFADPMPVPTILRDAINNVFDNGRGGKGALVLFAAGNDNREVGSNELTAVRGVTSIGAINHFFDKTFFTNYGPSLDIVAPVGTLTTDIVGAGGLDPTDYTVNFGGTSSACPVAAGAAALVMSAAPEKTSAEVLDLLIKTARPAPYASPHENGHDPIFGYGIVNPLAALKEALGIVDEMPDAGPDASPPPTTSDDVQSSCSCREGSSNHTPKSILIVVLLTGAGIWARSRSRHTQ
ncbi:MAG: S8 family serine peptidase [Polyangiaceae bacterium]|nr:S8 family serine peptidase [Polyangiaceae bacterium]